MTFVLNMMHTWEGRRSYLADLNSTRQRRRPCYLTRGVLTLSRIAGTWLASTMDA